MVMKIDQPQKLIIVAYYYFLIGPINRPPKIDPMKTREWSHTRILYFRLVVKIGADQALI
jgi:hypothetical protein